MKKLIIVSLLLPLGAFASSVSIGSVSVSGNSFSGNGSATYTGLDTLSVVLDNFGALLSGSTATSWNVSGTASAGQHTLTATVGSAVASTDFSVSGGGGLTPCQIDETCPNFGIFAPSIPAQNVLAGLLAWHYVAPGVEGCPAFFTMNCLVR